MADGYESKVAEEQAAKQQYYKEVGRALRCHGMRVGVHCCGMHADVHVCTDIACKHGMQPWNERTCALTLHANGCALIWHAGVGAGFGGAGRCHASRMGRGIWADMVCSRTALRRPKQGRLVHRCVQLKLRRLPPLSTRVLSLA